MVQSDDAATATLECDGERREVAVPWVVGCDGLHSAVREAARIEFLGTDIEAPWAVFDATIEGWQSDYDVVFPHLDVPPVILSPCPRDGGASICGRPPTRAISSPRPAR